MKTIFTSLLCLLAFAAFSQEETLFDDLEIIGAFGGPLIDIGKINGEVGASVGGGGALVLNNIFIGGYGVGTDFPEYEITAGEDKGFYNIRFRHGGLWLGYVPMQHKVVHFYGSAKIGWGKGRLRTDNDTRFSDRVFVMTPELGVDINVTSFLKISLTGGYRWVNGVTQLPGLDNADFSSPIGGITFRIGGFGYDDWDW